jgi:uncharacterized membrane protein YphA (DoxX/SURF4 family)
MESFKKIARIAYCVGLMGMVIPQLYYGKFGNNFFPPWPGLPWVSFWVGFFTVIVVVACLAIIFEKQPRRVSLILGGLLLAMYIFGDIPYEIIIDPYHNYLGSWADGLKELALAGGAFVVAGSFSQDVDVKKPGLIRWLEKLIPWGSIFFCITMILYGVCHFLYAKPISALVPNWIPGHLFWTYAAGVGLVGLGLAIVLRVKLKIAAMSLGAIIFIWLIILHTPRAITEPYAKMANEPVSAFSAFAFSAIAILIACNASKKKT